MDDLSNKPKELRCSNKPFPIERLHVEIFALILQTVVDEEAAHLLKQRDALTVRPLAATILALVCRRWRDVVFSFPSLWRVMSLNLKHPIEVQAKCDRLSQRSLNAPVDLYLWNVHLHLPVGGDAPKWINHDIVDCPCRIQEGSIQEKGNILIDFSRVTNIHNLLVSFTGSLAASFFTAATFQSKSLKNLHSLVLFILYDLFAVKRPLIDLNALFTYTPRLVSLDYDNIGTADLGFAEIGEPLLPKLRNLKLSSSRIHRVTPNILPQFLSHAPNIRFLEAYYHTCRTEAPLEPFPDMTLPSLRHMVVKLNPLEGAFSEGKIKAPLLEEFEYIPWDNTAIKNCRKFFSLHPSIKRLHIGITTDFEYGGALTSAVGVEELRITGDGIGRFLTPLYRPCTGHSLPVCAMTRILCIYLRGSPVQPSFFEALVRSRFRPMKEVDGHYYTADGYRPIEVLRVSARLRRAVSLPMMKTAGWKSAEVTMISETEYELRWPYRVDATELTATTTLLDETGVGER